jgi:cytosine/adenosine deaminase-related metal-dependent hydrolase
MRSTLITNLTLLVGDEFQKIDKANLLIENGTIRYFGRKQPDTGTDAVTVDGVGLLAIPGLIDAHTHIGDSIAKDLGVGKTLRELVHPLHGMKAQLLANESPELIREGMSQAAMDMLSCGITAFADFREEGLSGIELAKQALTDCKQRVLLLCRPNLVYSETDVGEEIALPEAVVNETKDALSICSGIGLSGANEYTDMALQQIGQLAKDGGKLIAIHAAESLDAVKFSSDKFHSTEVQRILRYMTPNAIVHATQASTDDVQKIAEHGVGVICCPRANATLGLGFPPISILHNHGVRVALGTDNVMLNAPDMFREMDYTARMIKATCLNPSAITSAQILRMGTASAADILGLGSTIGTLDVGKKADIVFLDLTAPNLNFSRDLVSSVVHRARPDNVACVMIDGEIVHGSIEN